MRYVLITEWFFNVTLIGVLQYKHCDVQRLLGDIGEKFSESTLQL